MAQQDRRSESGSTLSYRLGSAGHSFGRPGAAGRGGRCQLIQSLESESYHDGSCAEPEAGNVPVTTGVTMSLAYRGVGRGPAGAAISARRTAAKGESHSPHSNPLKT